MKDSINLRVASLAFAVLLILSVGTAAAKSSIFTDVVYSTALPFSLSDGILIAAVSVLAVTAGISLVYALSKLIKNQNLGAWSKTQMYEAFISLILLIAFASFAYILFINPTAAYSSAGLLPKSCISSANIYQLSVCDIGTFNSYALELNDYAIWIGYLYGFSPGIEFKYEGGIPFGAGVDNIGSVNLTVSSKLDSLLPGSLDSLIGLGVEASIMGIAITELQMIILSGSILFLSFFISIGLISRIFGFSRSFGGGLIALGVGLGIIYPLIVTVSYGFIVNAISNSWMSVVGSIPNFLLTLVIRLTDALTGNGLLNIPAVGVGSAGILAPFFSLFDVVGYTIVGFILIPIINFIILETFITDFSRAIGEQVGFLVLLGGFI